MGPWDGAPVAADHRAVEPDGFEAAATGWRRLPTDDAVRLDRLGLALDLDFTEIGQVERIAGQPARHLRDDDGRWLGGGLHAGGDVHRVAEGGVFVAQIRPDVPDHHRAVLIPHG